MIQKASFSPTNHLFREKYQRTHSSKNIVADVENPLENKENVPKRKIVPSDAEGIDDRCAWKRQCCNYDGDSFQLLAQGGNVAECMDEMACFDMMDNLPSTNDKQGPSVGVASTMMELDILSSGTESSTTMAVDGELCFLNPEDYYEDKWHRF